MKKLLAIALVGTLLAGCGTPMSLNGASAPSARLAAAGKKAKAPANVDKASFEQGHEAGLAKRAGKAPRVRQGNVDKLAYDYGFTVGLLQGSINSFDRINGSFDVSEWKAFAYMNRDAMQEALETLEANPDLAAKCAVTVGILSGGLQSFNSISGSFDVYQWKSFAYTNKKVLEQAFDSLKKVQL